MATVRTCDRCGKRGEPGTADIKQIVMPESPIPGAKEKKVDLCMTPNGCMVQLFDFLGEAIQKADDAPGQKARRAVTEGDGE